MEDIVITVKTEHAEQSVKLPWDTLGNDLVLHFVNMMRGMTYQTVQIIDALQEVEEKLREEIILGKAKLNNEE